MSSRCAERRFSAAAFAGRRVHWRNLKLALISHARERESSRASAGRDLREAPEMCLCDDVWECVGIIGVIGILLIERSWAPFDMHSAEWQHTALLETKTAPGVKRQSTTAQRAAAFCADVRLDALLALRTRRFRSDGNRHANWAQTEACEQRIGRLLPQVCRRQRELSCSVTSLPLLCAHPAQPAVITAWHMAWHEAESLPCTSFAASFKRAC